MAYESHLRDATLRLSSSISLASLTPTNFLYKLSDLRNIYVLERPAQVEFCAIRNWVYIHAEGSPIEIQAPTY
jgi:hypothetical protein